MPGLVKRKYAHQTGLYMKGFTGQLIKISSILPFHYNKKVILDLYKEYYPLQWEELNSRYKYYNSKDKHLQSVGEKARYNHEKPEQFFFNLAKLKHMVSKGQVAKHQPNYNEDKRQIAIEVLNKKRKVKEKKGSNLIQLAEPAYLDVFIAAYHKKGTSIRDKIEIFNEVKKYQSDGTIEFFQKLNDSERNDQIRGMAFKHLQSIGFYVRLRKKFKGKTKNYMVEHDSFDVSPEDLVKKLESDSIQNKKTYDAFISHSYLDTKLVKAVKNCLNEHGLVVYCDWTSDNDFLKRELTGEFTRMVLQRRIEQSMSVLFLQTDNSINQKGGIVSSWVEMEINHAESCDKKIYALNFTDKPNKFISINFKMSGDNITISKDTVIELRTYPGAELGNLPSMKITRPPPKNQT